MAEATGNFEAGAGSFNGEVAFHLRQADYYVGEKRPEGVPISLASVNTLELNVFCLKLFDAVN